MDTPDSFPRHVQRAVARKAPNLDRQGIYQYIILDPMMGQQFEGSNLDRAARRMTSVGKDRLEIKSFKLYHPYYPEDKERRIKLWFLGHPDDRKLAKLFAADQLRPLALRASRLCQPAYIDAALGFNKALSGAPCDVWWAIDLERPWFLARKKRPLMGIVRYL